VSVIPCEQDARLRAEIDRYAEALKTEAHLLGDHGLDEVSFYNSPIFRGAIEKVRGEFSATMRGKREFVRHVLNHMEDADHIAGWEPAKGGARNDYYVRLKSGRLAVIDQKGCLDGANTNIFERPRKRRVRYLEPLHEYRRRPSSQRLVRPPHPAKRRND